MPRISVPPIAPPGPGSTPEVLALQRSVITALQNLVQQLNNHGGTTTGLLDMNGNRITNLASAASGRDAVNVEYLKKVLGELGTSKAIVNVSLGGTTAIPGANTNVIINDGGALGADTTLTWDRVSGEFAVGEGMSSSVISMDRAVSTNAAQLQYTVGGNPSTAGAWIAGVNVGQYNILYGPSSTEYLQIADTGVTRFTGTSSGVHYPFGVRDVGGAAGIDFYTGTTTYRGSVSSGATAALSIQNGSSTHVLTLFQNGHVQVNDTTDRSFWFYVNGNAKILSTAAFADAFQVFNTGTSGVAADFSGTPPLALVNAGLGSTSENAKAINILTASNLGIFAGNGSPETVITAPQGSIYLRFNGGAGTTLYVKESGAGNTGWIGK